jgi:hypothetical protein
LTGPNEESVEKSIMMINKWMKLFLTILICTTALGAGKAEKKEIAISLTVPDSAWTISIDEVYEVRGELWVISSLSRDPDVTGLQVISTLKQSEKIVVPDLPVKHFVIGKTWQWKNKEPYTFIDNIDRIEAELKNGEILYKRDSK